MEGADTKTGQLLSRLWVSAKSLSTGALLPNFRITAAGGLPKGARQSTAYDGLQIVHWPCFNRLYEISHENISGNRAASGGPVYRFVGLVAALQYSIVVTIIDGSFSGLTTFGVYYVATARVDVFYPFKVR